MSCWNGLWILNGDGCTAAVLEDSAELVVLAVSLLDASYFFEVAQVVGFRLVFFHSKTYYNQTFMTHAIYKLYK